jgi:hypothetical protein
MTDPPVCGKNTSQKGANISYLVEKLYLHVDEAAHEKTHKDTDNFLSR